MNPISPYSGALAYGLTPPVRADLRLRGPSETSDPQPIGAPGDPLSKAAPPVQPSSGFDNILGTFVKEVSNKQNEAGDAVTALLSGKNIPLHQAMVSMEEANVSFQLMLEVRNKLLEGYQELMRMQV